jgi:hypothetical protein
VREPSPSPPAVPYGPLGSIRNSWGPVAVRPRSWSLSLCPLGRGWHPTGPVGSRSGDGLTPRSPELLTLHGCGALTAAKLIAETAGAKRFATDAKFARLAGVAPVPASSGKRVRYRLDRGGNRQLNCALHRIAVTQGKTYEPAQAFLARKQAEGKSRREALRCLKRHLARRVWQLLVQSEIERSRQSVDPQRDLLAPQIPAMA